MSNLKMKGSELVSGLEFGREISNQFAHEPVVVSIICLTYNHEEYIERTFQGFLEQRVNFRFEVLVGEDLSKDDTRSIVDKYCRDYPRLFKMISDEVNVGMNANFSRCLEQCKGKYIAMCEGDDYWTDSNKLFNQVEFLESNNDYVGCYHSFSLLVDNEVRESGKVFPESIDLVQMSQSVSPIQTMTVMFRNVRERLIPKSLEDKITGTYFIFLYLCQFGKWRYLDSNMAVYRIHSGGIWSGKENFKKAIMSLENIDAMCQYHKDNEQISHHLNSQYRQRCAYFILFFLARLKLPQTINLISLYRKNTTHTKMLCGITAYPKEVISALIRRVKK